jgi:hypothetical protein
MTAPYRSVMFRNVPYIQTRRVMSCPFVSRPISSQIVPAYPIHPCPYASLKLQAPALHTGMSVAERCELAATGLVLQDLNHSKPIQTPKAPEISRDLQRLQRFGDVW